MVTDVEVEENLGQGSLVDTFIKRLVDPFLKRLVDPYEDPHVDHLEDLVDLQEDLVDLQEDQEFLDVIEDQDVNINVEDLLGLYLEFTDTPRKLITIFVFLKQQNVVM